MYDLIVIGLGPAGINACIYAKRSNLNILVFEKSMPGGKLHTIRHVDNYLGYKDTSGSDLAMEFYRQFKSLDIPMVNEEVINVSLNGNVKVVSTLSGRYEAKAVIIATGRGARKLGILNEDLPGVSTCAVCDGALYRGKVVAVYGNNYKLVEDVNYLSNIASLVYVFTSKESFSFDVPSSDNIRYFYGSKLEKINGNDKISSIVVNDIVYEIDGLFINNEYGPITSFVSDLGITDDSGYILADGNGKTSVDGIYVCGDCKRKELYQIITAASEGAVCATDAYKYIKCFDK